MSDIHVIEERCNLILKYKNEVDYWFLIDLNAYLIKLYMGEKIGRYDFMLNGNMGYNGSSRMINEINNICKNNRCMFFVSTSLFKNDEDYEQFNRGIYDYVVNTYNKIGESESSSTLLYSNQVGGDALYE